MVREYKTIKQQSQARFTEKKSEFIGYASPVQTGENAITFIESIKSMHRRAKHNVYAYSIRENNIIRYSDDGEPQGTAGVPVLDMMRKNDITDTVIVVTRYFGGILLGTGGLVRAYSQAAKFALENGLITTMRYFSNLSIVCEYSVFGKISALILNFSGFIDDTAFSDIVSVKCHIPIENVKSLFEKIREATGGNAIISTMGESFYPTS